MWVPRWPALFYELIKSDTLLRSEHLPELIPGAFEFLPERGGDGLHELARSFLAVPQDPVDFLALVRR